MLLSPLLTILATEQAGLSDAATTSRIDKLISELQGTGGDCRLASGPRRCAKLKCAGDQAIA